MWIKVIKTYWWVPLVLIILFGVGKKLVAAFSPGGLLGTSENADREQEMRNDLDSVKPDQKKMSKDSLAIKSIADGLYNAMQDLGTNEDFIFKSLEGLNTEDLKAVFKAFGIRDNKLFGLVTVQSGNLFDWFQSELSNSDFVRMKEMFSKTGLI